MFAASDILPEPNHQGCSRKPLSSALPPPSCCSPPVRPMRRTGRPRREHRARRHARAKLLTNRCWRAQGRDLGRRRAGGLRQARLAPDLVAVRRERAQPGDGHTPQQRARAARSWQADTGAADKARSLAAAPERRWWVQPSGPGNALGLVKFDMQDDETINLHDTSDIRCSTASGGTSVTAASGSPTRSACADDRPVARHHRQVAAGASVERPDLR